MISNTSIVSFPDLYNALNSFIENHSADLHLLSKMTFRQIIFLYSACRRDDSSIVDNKTELILIEAIPKLGYLFNQPPLDAFEWLWNNEQLEDYNRKTVKPFSIY